MTVRVQPTFSILLSAPTTTSRSPSGSQAIVSQESCSRADAGSSCLPGLLLRVERIKNRTVRKAINGLALRMVSRLVVGMNRVPGRIRGEFAPCAVSRGRTPARARRLCARRRTGAGGQRPGHKAAPTGALACRAVAQARDQVFTDWLSAAPSVMQAAPHMPAKTTRRINARIILLLSWRADAVKELASPDKHPLAAEGGRGPRSAREGTRRQSPRLDPVGSTMSVSPASFPMKRNFPARQGLG